MNSKAGNGGAGKMIAGKEPHILEGHAVRHAERNEFRIKIADDVFKDNLIAFAYTLSTGYTSLGMYTTEEAAQEIIEAIRTTMRDGNGKTLL